MRTLYDAWGKPLNRDLLRQELAGPTVTGVRSPLSGHPAQGLTPERLARLHLRAEEGDAEGYLELAEEMEEKELHYRSVLGTRKLQVAGLEITVESATDAADDVRAADLVRDVLRSGAIQDGLFDVLDAVGKGFSVCEILWDTEGRCWTPTELRWRDPRWFVFEQANGTVLNLRDANGLPVPLTPGKFVRHVHKSKSGLPVRGGLARAVSWGYLFKNFDIKSWVVFCEVYGHPLRLGKYGPHASEEDRQTLLRAVRNVAADHAAIVPDSMLIDFIDAKAQGNAQVFERLADYLDKQVSKAVLGQTGTTDAGSRVGTADAHERVRADIETSDAVQLSATLNRDLVRTLVDLNVGPRTRYPRLRVYRPKQEDVSALVDNLVKLLPHAPNLAELSFVRDKLGIPEPAQGAVCLGRESEPRADRPPDVRKAAAGEEGDADPAPAGKQGTTRSAKSAQSALPPAPEQARPGADAGQTGEQTKDGIDRMIDALCAEDGEGWEPLLDPLLAPVRDLVTPGTNDAGGEVTDPARYAAFLAGLPEALTAQNPAALADKLAQALFIIRVLREAGRG